MPEQTKLNELILLKVTAVIASLGLLATTVRHVIKEKLFPLN